MLVSLVIMTVPMPSQSPNTAEAAGLTQTSRKMWVTAYSSSVDETDDTPFLTASQTETRDGVVATNMLPFGTKVMIPKLFGDKIFVVEDRMHPRKVDYLDVWRPSKKEAFQIGRSYLDVVVLE